MTDHSTSVLVTGGAGYIGSHTARALAAQGYLPVTYDNLVYGHQWAVRWGPFVEGDVGDRTRLVQVMRDHRITAVLHFAAFAYVGESMTNAQKYFQNNLIHSLALLDAMLEAGVHHLVFSSSCATYGVPDKVPITEDCPQLPVNPYGETKLMVERALKWYGIAHHLHWAALRYFNAAGAETEHGLGEAHDPETHLIPLVLDAAMGRREVEIYGDDYPTPDGTCVRDYIHVSDLAHAHVLALEYLMRGGTSRAFNLGTGNGHSVKKIVAMVRQITGRATPCRVAPGRPGDPAILVADASLANQVLGWRPGVSSLESIVRSAWQWHSRLRKKPEDPSHNLSEPS